MTARSAGQGPIADAGAAARRDRIVHGPPPRTSQPGQEGTS
ncbi:hypothetical protein [Streptomyces deserti]